MDTNIWFQYCRVSRSMPSSITMETERLVAELTGLCKSPPRMWRMNLNVETETNVHIFPLERFLKWGPTSSAHSKKEIQGIDLLAIPSRLILCGY